MNNIIRNLIKFLFYKYYLRTPKRIVDYLYKRIFNTNINWDAPKTLNEKINWLKIYGNTSLWTELADKYLVRNYIAQKGLSDILVTIYGAWKNADEIDLDILPNKFVLKTNHGCGGVYLIKNKELSDFNVIRERLNADLKMQYGFYQGEPHYMGIQPLIIAEALLEEENSDHSVVDYKVWCFNGQPYCIFVCYNRTNTNLYVECYDLEWNFHPEWLNSAEKIKIGSGVIARPKRLEYILECARTLSSGFPQVRVDFYHINDKVYFGEMTFTSLGGFMTYFTNEALNTMGDKVNIDVI